MLLKQRTFFGVLRVYQLETGVNEQHQLLSGTTLHGVQFPGSARRPTSYYGELTGIGLALAQRASNEPSTIGVVGLGIGTLAAYGRPGDRFRFYEIDPAVIEIARNPRYFTYLVNSPAEVEIVEGDGRVSPPSELERGGAARFDYLIIDAFSSDAIPMHLLTREAFEVYAKVLAAKGLLAIHTSSRRLDLTPLVARLGESTASRPSWSRRAGRRVSERSVQVGVPEPRPRADPFARAAREAAPRQLGLGEGASLYLEFSAAEIAATPLWTDDYSDLFAALKPISFGSGAAPER